MPGNDKSNNKKTGNRDYIGSHSRSGNYIGGSSERRRSENAERGGKSPRDYKGRVEEKRVSGRPAAASGNASGKRHAAYGGSNSAPVVRSGGGTYTPGSRIVTYTRRSRLGSFIKLGLISAAVLIGLYYIISGVLLSGVSREKTDTDWDDRPANASAGLELADRALVDTILFIGADSDGGSGSRSDTLMYASYNRLTGRLRLCSVLRDSYVEIPGHSASKINAAFSYGSDELCMRTLESNFRIKTRKFIRVNMDALIVAIDELGGVDITLSKAEAKAINKHFHIKTFSQGNQLLMGQYALYYARIRKTDDDFHRVSRQRELLYAVAKKCRKTSPVKLCAVLNKAAPYVATNLSSVELSRLSYDMLIAMGRGGGPEQLIIPAEGTWSYKQINGQSCIAMDVGANALLMREFLLFND